MPNIYELYSDERQNHVKRELILGGLICTVIGARRIGERLEQIRKEFRLMHESYWRKGITAPLSASVQSLGRCLPGRPLC